MRRAFAPLVAAGSLGLAACLPQGPSPPPPPPGPCQGATATARPTAPKAHDGRPLSPPEAEARAEEAFAAAGGADVPLVTVEETPAGPDITTTRVDDPEEAKAVARDAAGDGNLVAVEVDSPVTALDHPPADDALRPSQWALNAVAFEHAAAQVAGGAGQVVAVVDTGVQATHPDLAGQVLPGRFFLDGGQFEGPNTSDDNGHGTHVSGIVAAVDNTIGIIGAAPAVDILPVKVLCANGEGFNSDVASGIVWAVNNGADVINLSLGGSESLAVREAVEHARNQGVVVVAAAGNAGGVCNLCYPGALDQTIAVGATQQNGAIALFSNQGDFVDLAAPGAVIISTLNNSGYTEMSGTSMATPHVSAAAALVRAAHGTLGPVDVCNQLIRTADDRGDAGFDPAFGHGLVDPAEAVGPIDATGPTCT